VVVYVVVCMEGCLFFELIVFLYDWVDDVDFDCWVLF